jgi:predicted Zn finger-like uncharacterized protein
VKFLCDNCKAKYQIADEKVAGKTVRMKCRKCGHQIEVRAAVTETSVSSAPPRPPLTGAAPRPPQKSLATSLSAAKPRAPSPSVAPGGALAGAFKSNVQDAPASVPGDSPSTSIELSVTDEWYVAINGVPVGPVRISELRRKAAAGAVTEESLCWQEGLEEWRPIRSIPELAAIVREAALGNRPSLIGTPPPPDPAPVAARPPAPPSAPRQAATAPQHTPPPPAPRPMVPSAPSAAPFGGGRSNVVPLRPAASSSIDEVPVGPIGGSGSAAAIAPSLSPAPPAAMFAASPVSAPLPVPSVAADPFAVPPAAPAPAAPYRDASVASIVPPTPSYEAQKKGVPLWFWPILVLALGFGGGIAFLAFRPQPAPAPVVIQVPTPTPPAATVADKGEVPPPPASAEVAPTASAETKSKTGPVAAKGPTNAPKAPDVPEKKGLDLGNLVPGAGGPNVGPNTSPGAGGSGGLDQAGVERVVAMHRTGVKRTCWERGGGEKSSVNVTVTANVAPNGSVASTSSSGDDPVVAKCIENQVRAWQFPAPGSSTTINIPFKFVRQ